MVIFQGKQPTVTTTGVCGRHRTEASYKKCKILAHLAMSREGGRKEKREKVLTTWGTSSHFPGRNCLKLVVLPRAFGDGEAAHRFKMAEGVYWMADDRKPGNKATRISHRAARFLNKMDHKMKYHHHNRAIKGLANTSCFGFWCIADA